MNQEMCFVRCLIAVMFGFGLRVHGEQPINVNTQVGTFSGISGQTAKLGAETRNVSVFLGIPFAKPPMGDRRFKRPEPAVAIDSVYDATFHRPHCMQSERFNPFISKFNMSEDCLYLNIYLPGTKVQEEKLPVMIWIYGGGFMFGGADTYDASSLSAFNDVIVVTFNYRTSVFGFLTDGEKSSGNYGLWDQTLAIQWVHDNIYDFGGDPDRVTLFGESAGAVSVLYQALYPGNSGRFNKVIVQSGSVFAPWSLQNEPVANFKSFAKTMGCADRSTARTYDCLRNKTAGDLLIKELNVAATVDGEFISANLQAGLLSESDLNSVMAPLQDIEFLSGVNSKEGFSFLGLWTPLFESMGENVGSGISRLTFETAFVPNVLKQSAFDNDVTKKAATYVYTDWSDENNKEIIRDKIIDFLSDVNFFVPAINLATLHGSMSTRGSYFYVFDHILPAVFQQPQWLQGVPHVMEIPYVFGMSDGIKIPLGYEPSAPFPLQPGEYRLSEEIMSLWTNFAKTGDPNTPVPLSGGVVWPTFDPADQRYLHITPNMTTDSVKRSFAGNRVAFWNQLVPSLQRCGSQSPANQPVNSAVNLRTSEILVAFLIAATIILY